MPTTVPFFRPTLTILESRDTPAGVVTTHLTKGVLTLVGDDNHNAVLVTGIPGVPGSVRITGDTKAIFHGVHTLRIDLNDGFDTLSISHLELPGHLLVNTGAGGDLVALNGVRLGGKAHFDLGDGYDGLSILDNGLRARSLRIDMGSGNDSVMLAAPVTVRHNLTVHGGAGDDHLRSTGMLTVGGPTRIHMGDGQDNTKLSGRWSKLHSLTLTGGDGNDTLSLQGLTIHGGVRVHGGDGDDTLTIDDGTYRERGKIVGGAGNDQITISSTSKNWRVFQGRRVL